MFTESDTAGSGNDPTQGARRPDPRLGPPAQPVQAAPARFGAAGISAGEDIRFKSEVTLETRPRSPDDKVVALAKGLGWFSIALGAAEVLFAGRMGRAIGLEGKSSVIRAYGVREISTGVALLRARTPRQRTLCLLGRIFGDVVDAATIAPALSKSNEHRAAAAGAMVFVIGALMTDVFAATLSAQR